MNTEINSLPEYRAEREGKGIQISYCSEGFPEQVKREINDHLLEFWATDSSQDAFSIYPLETEDSYLFSVSTLVVEGSTKEARKRNKLKGYIVNKEYLLENFDILSNIDINETLIGEYSSKRKIIYYAVKEIIENNRNIWIRESDPDKIAALQYMIYLTFFKNNHPIAQKLTKQLYTISFGECIGNEKAQAKIIIAREIDKMQHRKNSWVFYYQEEHTIEAFFKIGEERAEKERAVKEARREREEQKRAAQEAREREKQERAAQEAREREEQERAAQEAREREEQERAAREAREREEQERAAREAREREEQERAAQATGDQIEKKNEDKEIAPGCISDEETEPAEKETIPDDSEIGKPKEFLYNNGEEALENELAKESVGDMNEMIPKKINDLEGRIENIEHNMSINVCPVFSDSDDDIRRSFNNRLRKKPLSYEQKDRFMKYFSTKDSQEKLSLANDMDSKERVYLEKIINEEIDAQIQALEKKRADNVLILMERNDSAENSNKNGKKKSRFGFFSKNKQ